MVEWRPVYTFREARGAGSDNDPLHQRFSRCTICDSEYPVQGAKFLNKHLTAWHRPEIEAGKIALVERKNARPKHRWWTILPIYKREQRGHR